MNNKQWILKSRPEGMLKKENFEFREGKPTDFITLSVGYDYQSNKTNKYNDLLKFLEDIQPNKEERDYMLTYLSIGLVGNLLELFTILTSEPILQEYIEADPKVITRLEFINSKFYSPCSS